MLVRTKLCGIRSIRDLETAVAAGASAVGFICGTTHFTEDGLTAEEATQLAHAVPPYVATVLVTHLEQAEDILRLADTIGVDTIQVHGLVTYETALEVFRRASGRRITKAIHVTGPEAIAEARRYADVAHAIHLDSRTEDRLGGTGQTHDWAISRQIADDLRDLGCRCVLSGGLKPSNVAAAIEAVRPYAVDVNSGIEDANGDKSPELAAAFVRASEAEL